ncbi:MAG: DUF1592 domain-containing protein [Bacteroidales bacterium]|nr:DUF1592 domain-containing protein [Bacteroidales bacterium]
MRQTLTQIGYAVLVLSACSQAIRAGDAQPALACPAADDPYFLQEVWPKVVARSCLTCHKAGGDAEKSRLILRDPARVDENARAEVFRQNRDAFVRLALVPEKNASRLLVKVTGGLDHGGGDVLTPDSAGYRILAEFVRRSGGKTPHSPAIPQTTSPRLPPLFTDVVMLEPTRLLRRATLSLAGRLPTAAELAAVKRGQLSALPAILDQVMAEDAFYERLREGFNDIFLTDGLTGTPETATLSYDHFHKTRLWYQKFDLSHIPDEKARRQAGYKLAKDYRAALTAEPMRLIEYIVRQNRPFTEIVTADYIMVSPYTARGYGIFDEVKSRFQNPDNPFEYIPVRLRTLVGREKSQNQESATGFYPHAGLLSTFQYLARYPTTETNRNRLRTRMYYQHFLGVDLLELAARVSDAAAVTAQYKVPTMQAPECVVCHRTMDPVAGLFQDYWKFADQGLYGRRKGGWFSDMFSPGFEGENLPPSERWRALQWLGERTAQDPRFATTMVEHVYFILTGRRVLLPPKDESDPLFAAHEQAYREQRKWVDLIAGRFRQSGFNLKNVFKDWIFSDFYRADGVATRVTDPARKAALDDVGMMRLLSPEQLERKTAAIFGEPWGRLHDQMAMLYGGIDSQEVTERATDPSGAMGAIQRLLANEVACRQVARDFARPATERRFFAHVEPDTLPGSEAADQKIRETIVQLHSRILGRNDRTDSTEVDETFQLFAAIVQAAQSQKQLDTRETYACRQSTPAPPADPHYTIRAWRAVMTYLMRRPEFLYE